MSTTNFLAEQYLDIPIMVQIDAPVNRHEKREMQRELNRIYPMLSEVEDAFLVRLHSPGFKGYKELYIEHLILYEEALTYIEIFIQPRYFKVNALYFSSLYKPLEKEMT